MCMEDVRIGRKKITRSYVYVWPDTTNLTIAADPHRTHLSFHGYSSDGSMAAIPGLVLTRTGGKPIGFGFGGSVTAGFFEPMLDFDVETHGDVVCGPWTVGSLGAGNFAVIIETFLYEE